MDRCSANVYDSTGWHRSQCLRKSIVVVDGKRYCKQHDPMAVRMRARAREAKSDERLALRERTKTGAERLAARLGAGSPIYMPGLGSRLGSYMDGVYLTPAEVESLITRITHGGQHG